MWNFISVPDYSLEQVQQYLIRSKMSRLTVIFAIQCQPQSTSEERDDYNQSVIRTLQPHMDRIRYLALYDLSNKKLPSYMATFLHAAVELEHLRLSVLPVQQLFGFKHLRNIVVSCRSSILSELVLLGIPPVPELLCAEMLSHLTLEHVRMDVKDLQKLLTKFSHSLNTLKTIDPVFDKQSGVSNTKAIDFPKLVERADRRRTLGRRLPLKTQ